MATYTELKKQAEDLMCQAEAARKSEIGAAIADIKGKMAAYGIALEDLGGKVGVRRGRKPKAAKAGRPAKAASAAKANKTKPAKARKAVAIKYRNPETGDTWTGRGQPSKWLKALEAAGRKREEFLVG